MVSLSSSVILTLSLNWIQAKGHLSRPSTSSFLELCYTQYGCKTLSTYFIYHP